MPRAKLTSKGQITIPAEVRRALGVDTGDTLAFEVRGDYAVVSRPPRLVEVLERLDGEGKLGPRRYPTDREGVISYFRESFGDDVLGEVFVTEGKAPE